MIYNNNIGCPTGSETTVFLDVVGSTAQVAPAEEVLSPPGAHAHITTVGIYHFDRFANPAGSTAPGHVPPSTADAAAVPPPTVAH